MALWNDEDARLLVRLRVVLRADDDVGAALAPVGTGEPRVRHRALPEVDESTGRHPAGILDHQRPVLQARELQDVGGGQVSRHDAPLLLERVQDDEVGGVPSRRRPRPGGGARWSC